MRPHQSGPTIRSSRRGNADRPAGDVAVAARAGSGTSRCSLGTARSAGARGSAIALRRAIPSPGAVPAGDASAGMRLRRTGCPFLVTSWNPSCGKPVSSGSEKAHPFAMRAPARPVVGSPRRTAASNPSAESPRRRPWGTSTAAGTSASASAGLANAVLPKHGTAKAATSAEPRAVGMLRQDAEPSGRCAVRSLRRQEVVPVGNLWGSCALGPRLPSNASCPTAEPT